MYENAKLVAVANIKALGVLLFIAVIYARKDVNVITETPKRRNRLPRSATTIYANSNRALPDAVDQTAKLAATRDSGLRHQRKLQLTAKETRSVCEHSARIYAIKISHKHAIVLPARRCAISGSNSRFEVLRTDHRESEEILETTSLAFFLMVKYQVSHIIILN